MVALGLAALTLLSFLLRWPTFKVALENNGASYLYNARFRTDEVDCTGLIGLVYLLNFCYRLLGDRWGYRWTHVVMAIANALVVAPAYALGAALGGPVAGWAAAGMYAVFSNVPHFIPWVTSAERVCVALSTCAYTALLAPAGHSPAWAALSGLLAGACILCKVTSALEFVPLLAYSCLSSTGAMDAALRSLLLLAGMALLPSWEGFRLWRAGQILGTASSLKHLRERYAAADRSLVEVRAGIKEGSVALHWWLDLVSGTLPVWVFAIVWVAHSLLFSRTAPHMVILGWYAATLAVTAYRANWVPGHWVPQFPPLCVIAGLAVAGVAASGGAASQPTFLAAVVLIYGSFRAWSTGRVHAWSAAQYLVPQGLFEELGYRIKARTSPSDRIFCWGWHPQVYLYAERHSAAPRMLFCGVTYLDLALPDWRWELAKAFVAHQPACVVLLAQGMPWGALSDLAGLRYEPSTEDLGVRKISLLIRVGASQGGVALPQDLLADCQKRAHEVLAAGDAAQAEVLLRAMVDLGKGTPEVLAQLDEVLPGWRWVAKGALPEPSNEPVIEEAKDGSRTLGIRQGSEVRWLHSRYNPKAEAIRLAEQLEPQAGGAYLVLGVGLGHHLVELARRVPADATIYGIERRRAIVKAAQAEQDLLRSDRVRLIAAAAPPALARLLESLTGMRVYILVHPPSYDLDREYYDAVIAFIKGRSLPPPK